MGIGDIFKKIWGVLSAAGPIVMELKGVIEYAARMFQIAMNSGDRDKVALVVRILRRITQAIREWADEIDDVAAAAEQAVSADGDAGHDISGTELLTFAGEVDDLPAASSNLVKVLRESMDELKNEF